MVLQFSDFYPRSPCGERRWLRCWQLAARDISIHALLAESDSRPKALKSRRIVFLSTLSLRRATMDTVKLANTMLFLSTLSLRRATLRHTISFSAGRISIHALLAESDRHWQVGQNRLRQFLSTLSLRRATQPPRFLLS